jgi:hypothetical protein
MQIVHKRVVAAVAVIVLLAAAGVAYATIPDGGGVIHGCFTKSGGSLRVIDAGVVNCKSTESALNWNVAGPPGPQGQQGPTGPQVPAGPQGPSGSSHGYIVSTSQVPVAAFPVYSQVALLSSVPAGIYMVWGQVHLGDAVNTAGSAWCRIAVNGTKLAGSETQGEYPQNTLNLSIASAATLTGAGSSVEVDCRGNGTELADVNLTLIRVDALN